MFYAVYSNASCIRVQYSIVEYNKSLRGKCPNTEFFLVGIFPHSDQKKLRIWTLFTQCLVLVYLLLLVLPIIKISFSRVEYMLHFIFLQNIFCFNGKHGNDLSEYAKCL